MCNSNMIRHVHLNYQAIMEMFFSHELYLPSSYTSVKLATLCSLNTFCIKIQKKFSVTDAHILPKSVVFCVLCFVWP